MRILVGLGNPGKEYERNRHNVGFMVVDALADALRFPAFSKRITDYGARDASGEDVLLLKPTTYMNRSGFAVLESMSFKSTIEDVLVFHDELDLPPAQLRTKRGGGAAGHNGLKSIDAMCGNPYLRARIGIGHPGHREQVTGWVLGDFTREEADAQHALIQNIVRNIGSLMQGEYIANDSHSKE